MANVAFIRDIASLDQLIISISRFCEESENQLNVIDSKLVSRVANLKANEFQFQRILDAAQNSLRDAYAALADCEADTYTDEDGDTHYPDCSYDKEELSENKNRLLVAEQNYSAFKREIRNLEAKVAEFQNPKIRYRSVIQFEKESSTSSLKQLINGAEDYLAVSSPSANDLSNGLGLTESISKIDPTMILAATIGAGEIMIMSIFSFLGSSGDRYSFNNNKQRDIIATTYSENGKTHVCSELKIENRESGNVGKILSVNIPPELQSEKIGKSLVANMETNCRANDCNEINGWANSANIQFYKSNGYNVRNEIKGSGGEVFKSIDSSYNASQKNVKNAFQNLKNGEFGNTGNLGKQQINPLSILTPIEIDDEKFWKQHGEDQSRYIELVEKYEKCDTLLKEGKTIDEIRKADFWVANAHDVFHGSEPVRLLKLGDYYKVEANGRHRVAAAQLYYLQTGKIINIPADIIEKQ